MIKNLAILLLGALLGIGGMLLVQTYYGLQEADSSLRLSTEQSSYEQPEVKVVDIDTVYDQLMEEKRGKTEKKHWFDEKLDKMDAKTSEKTKKLQSEGDEAAKLFDEFSEAP